MLNEGGEKVQAGFVLSTMAAQQLRQVGATDLSDSLGKAE